MSPDVVQATLLRALEQYRSNALSGAERACTEVLAAHPDNFDALNLLGLIYLRDDRPEQAAAAFQKAIALQPDNPGALNNLGMALRATQKADEALLVYDKAISLMPGYAVAHTNRGNALTDLGRPSEAIACYDASLKLRPEHPDTLFQRGVALQHLRRHDEAIACFDQALSIQPDHARAFERRGKSLGRSGKIREGISDLEQALKLEPGTDFLPGLVLHERTKLCDWSDFERQRSALESSILNGDRVSLPFTVLAMSDDPKVQRQAAETWIAATKRHASTSVPATPLPTTRIHLGFFSADLRTHAVWQLLAETITRYDREKFRLTAFSLARGDVAAELAGPSFDEFIPISHLSDQEAAALSREKNVDIAIDLQGYTEGMRPRIFLNRAAPVQVGYLGYPGTTASPEIDYLIADKTIIPPENSAYFSEQIAYLPNSLKPRDTRIQIGPASGDRLHYGLPESGFVFCCFNNAYKITPDVFAIWMSILRRVPDSVLWLLHKAETVENLKREAVARGVAAERLIFAPREPLLGSHLARHRLADLFLDTLPYNAHTTASDALIAGLPVLTRIGKGFPGRVAASLLRAIGLPELVTETVEEYEELAVRLAQTPGELAALTETLRRNATTHPLFDMAAYTHNMEALFTIMHERRLAGLPPAPIDLGDTS